MITNVFFMFLLRLRSYNLQSFEKQHVWLLSDVAVYENTELWFLLAGMLFATTSCWLAAAAAG